MCLGVPGRLVSISEDGFTGVADFFGVSREIALHVVDEPVKVGDYVLNHVGFAIRRIPDEEVQATLEMYARLVREFPGEVEVVGEGAAGSTGYRP